ncbi:MAG: hypothetical protein ACH0QD_13360 [Tepidibacillus sp.]
MNSIDMGYLLKETLPLTFLCDKELAEVQEESSEEFGRHEAA